MRKKRSRAVKFLHLHLSLKGCVLFLFFFILFSINDLSAQEKQLYQVKTLDQKLNPYRNIKISFNGKTPVSMGEKGISFVELSSSDFPIRSVDVDDKELETASWNISKGTIEIIIRKKSYRMINVAVIDSENNEITGAEVIYKGRKTLSAITGETGKVQFPLALDERITSQNQIEVKGYNNQKLSTEGDNYVLLVEKIIISEPVSEQPEVAIAEPLEESGSLDMLQLDTIQTLAAFYEVFKNYEIDEFDEETQRLVEAKYNELVTLFQDSLSRASSVRKQIIISDSTFVQDDVKGLLEQARAERDMLVGQQTDFEQKMNLVSEKLEGGFQNLNEEARQNLLNDLLELEKILAENESRFNSSQNNYRQMVNSLMERFFNMEELEDKLSASEARRLEEQRIFRQRLFTILSVAAIFALLIILLVYLSSKLNQQKKKLQLANAEVKRINENLEAIVYERTKLLEETNKELDTVLYRASHDLRAPICSIVGLCNLATTLSNGENNELFERMIQTTEGMDKLLKKLSVISEINQPGTFSTFSMAGVVNSVEYKFKNFIKDYKINFEVECPDDLVIYSNINLIEVILINLIENALFYCVIKNTEDYKVKFSAMVQENQLELSIYDNGVGVDTTMSDRLFEMFYRGNEQSRGNGLGLYIVQKSVYALDGNISIDSEPGKYSKFMVHLPLIEEPEEALENTEAITSDKDKKEPELLESV